MTLVDRSFFYLGISDLEEIKERKQITKLFINLNLDDIVQLKFTDHVFVPMSTFTCCQKTTAFCMYL